MEEARARVSREHGRRCPRKGVLFAGSGFPSSRQRGVAGEERLREGVRPVEEEGRVASHLALGRIRETVVRVRQGRETGESRGFEEVLALEIEGKRRWGELRSSGRRQRWIHRERGQRQVRTGGERGREEDIGRAEFQIRFGEYLVLFLSL